MPYLVPVDDASFAVPVDPPAIYAPAAKSAGKGKASARKAVPAPASADDSTYYAEDAVPGTRLIPATENPVKVSGTTQLPRVSADVVANPGDQGLAAALTQVYPGAQVQKVERPVVREVRNAKGKVLRTEQTVETAYVLVLPQVVHQVREPSPAQVTEKVVTKAPEPVEYALKGNTLMTTPEITNALRGLKTTDGPALARAVAGLYRAKGYLTVEAMVVDGSTIQIVEGTSVVSGKYRDYVAQAEVLGADDIDGYKALAMRRAVRANGDMLDMRILPRGMTRTGQAEVMANGEHDASIKPVTTVGVTNQGPRYSGATVGIASVSGVAQGWEYKATGTSNLGSDQESEGGKYRSIGLTAMKPTYWGSYGVELSSSNYKTGGDALEMDVRGSTTKMSAVAQWYLANGLNAEARLNNTSVKSRLGIMDAQDDYNYQSVSGHLSYNGRAADFDLHADGMFEQGLSGQRKVGDLPLQGTISKNFTVGAGNFELGRHWNALKAAGVTFNFGGQVGTDGTPSNSQFALGGAGRGSAYHPGVASTPTGAYVGLTLDGPVLNLVKDSTVQPYVGYNFATGKPTAGEALKVASGELGARFMLSPKLTGGINFAKRMDGNDTMDKSRVNFYVTGVFD